ncbi:unnamed protein product [Linum trigynum]|uniref:Uncharacterized protein n=1 Tax=Linum trigynum TaxID=586398 RepID=A0AAV2ERH1_9ROSI
MTTLCNDLSAAMIGEFSGDENSDCRGWVERWLGRATEILIATKRRIDFGQRSGGKLMSAGYAVVRAGDESHLSVICRQGN